MEPRFQTIDGLAVRVAESQPRDPHALLLSPWPESLLAYEQMWTRLAEYAHLVAIDLPGFGRSERRQSLLSPAAMGEFIVHAADAFGLENPHAVGPGQCTAALLFAAARHPGRLRSLVVGGAASGLPLQLGGVVQELVNAGDDDVYCATDSRQIVSHVLRRIERYELPDDVLQDYLGSYDGSRFRDSIDYVRSYPLQLPVLDDLLPGIHAPVQIIAGRRDPMVQLNARFLHERLPNSSIALVDAGHFVWEEAADDYAAVVTSWWNAT
jgi:pimeloyl-ACP methyl ester carboxylesterase